MNGACQACGDKCGKCETSGPGSCDDFGCELVPMACCWKIFCCFSLLEVCQYDYVKRRSVLSSECTFQLPVAGMDSTAAATRAKGGIVF